MTHEDVQVLLHNEPEGAIITFLAADHRDMAFINFVVRKSDGQWRMVTNDLANIKYTTASIAEVMVQPNHVWWIS